MQQKYILIVISSNFSSTKILYPETSLTQFQYNWLRNNCNNVFLSKFPLDKLSFNYSEMISLTGPNDIKNYHLSEVFVINENC